jgi:transposase
VELVVRLHARVAELEATVARLGGPPKTPGNSSIPPSQGFKPDRAERRARRKRGGPLGLSRRRQEPDLVARCRPTSCRGCGAALAERDQKRVGRSQVVDLPPVRPVVVEAWRYAAVCPGCGERTVAEAPPGLEPERVFGPGVEALLGYLHERHHLGYERLVEVCRDLFGLAISEGAVANALARLAERARPRYEAIGAEVRGSPVVNSDETSARVDGRNRWQWVFQTPGASYHVIAPSRGADVIDRFLEGAEPEVWGSDLWAPQVGTAAGAHQVCMSHQVRDLTYAEEADGPAGQQWARDLRHVFGRALRLHHERAQVSPAGLRPAAAARDRGAAAPEALSAASRQPVRLPGARRCGADQQRLRAGPAQQRHPPQSHRRAPLHPRRRGCGHPDQHPHHRPQARPEPLPGAPRPHRPLTPPGRPPGQVSSYH